MEDRIDPLCRRTLPRERLEITRRRKLSNRSLRTSSVYFFIVMLILVFALMRALYQKCIARFKAMYKKCIKKIRILTDRMTCLKLEGQTPRKAHFSRVLRFYSPQRSWQHCQQLGDLLRVAGGEGSDATTKAVDGRAKAMQLDVVDSRIVDVGWLCRNRSLIRHEGRL